MKKILKFVGIPVLVVAVIALAVGLGLVRMELVEDEGWDAEVFEA